MRALGSPAWRRAGARFEFFFFFQLSHPSRVDSENSESLELSGGRPSVFELQREHRMLERIVESGQK